MQQPTKDEMVNVLERQQTDFLEEGAVAFKTRIDRLERVINILKSNESRLLMQCQPTSVIEVCISRCLPISRAPLGLFESRKSS